MSPQYIDLMQFYPVPNNRLEQRYKPSENDKAVAKMFGKDFFDGDRRFGYGGFTYNPRFWTKTVELFIDYFALGNNSSVLDVGCGKGFMLVDFHKALPRATLAGIDISEYAIANAHESVKSKLQVANCLKLPYPDSTFDLVISINTIHNLDRFGCIQALREIERVKVNDSYVVVDGWSSINEKRDLESWVLTAETVLSHSQWRELFDEAGYTGKYSFWKVR